MFHGVWTLYQVTWERGPCSCFLMKLEVWPDRWKKNQCDKGRVRKCLCSVRFQKLSQPRCSWWLDMRVEIKLHPPNRVLHPPYLIVRHWEEFLDTCRAVSEMYTCHWFSSCCISQEAGARNHPGSKVCCHFKVGKGFSGSWEGRGWDWATTSRCWTEGESGSQTWEGEKECYQKLNVKDPVVMPQWVRPACERAVPLPQC